MAMWVCCLLLLAVPQRAQAFQAPGFFRGTQLAARRCCMRHRGDPERGLALSSSSSTRMSEALKETERLAVKEKFIAAARAGPKNGVGATPEQRAAIEGKLSELIALNPTQEPAVSLLRPPYRFFDGTYSLLYTNTTGGSSGKLGPFVGDVTQTFEGMRDNDQMGFSRRGIFSNAAQFGPLRTSLRARCESRGDTKLNIVFEELSIFVFGVRVSNKPFEQGGKGTRGSWDLKYIDEDLRVLRTNAGNVLVLKKGEPFGGESYMEKQKRLGSVPY
jgi:hypothetical protein